MQTDAIEVATNGLVGTDRKLDRSGHCRDISSSLFGREKASQQHQGKGNAKYRNDHIHKIHVGCDMVGEQFEPVNTFAVVLCKSRAKFL
jgi:hypothetical protein